MRSVLQRPAVKDLIDHEPVGYLKVSDPLGCRTGEGQAWLEETLSLGAVFEGTTGGLATLFSLFSSYHEMSS